MSTALAFLPLALMPVFYALVAKAAAFLFRRTQLRWLHSFVFGALLAVVGLAGTFVHWAAGSPLPLPVAVLVSLSLLAAVGGWYLGSRAKSQAGEALQFKGGALLSIMTLAMVAVFSVVFAVLIPLLLHSRQV